MSLRNTIHSHFVLPLLRQADAKGFPPEKFLSAAGLPADLMNQPRIRFTPDQYAIITRLLWKETDDAFFGMSAQPVRLGTLFLFCQLAVKEVNVGGVLEKQAECFRLATKDIRWNLRTAGDHALLSLSVGPKTSDTEHVLREFLLAMTYRFASWIAGSRIVLTRAWFDYPKPEYAAEYMTLFDCPCLFDQSMMAIEFPASVLSWPNIRTKVELLSILKNSPFGILVNPVVDKSIVVQVRRILLGKDRFRIDFPSLESVAETLAMSPGTLRRRLKSEHTSFQAMKEAIRRDVAIELLSDRRKSVSDVALALGYTESSTFSRAFKGWTGLSPAAYRSHDEEVAGP